MNVGAEEWFNSPDPGGTCGLYFGSVHNLMQAVFCDGAVHRINFSISPTVWGAMCSVNDGKPVTFDD